MSSGKELKNTDRSEEFQLYETQSFKKSFEKYKHLQSAVENKLRFLKNNAFSGEPLKYELAGFRSISVKRNFLILYGICRECRKSRKIADSAVCQGAGDDAVVLYAFGPHDDLYKIARKIMKEKPEQNRRT